MTPASGWNVLLICPVCTTCQNQTGTPSIMRDRTVRVNASNFSGTSSYEIAQLEFKYSASLTCRTPAQWRFFRLNRRSGALCPGPYQSSLSTSLYFTIGSNPARWHHPRCDSFFISWTDSSTNVILTFTESVTNMKKLSHLGWCQRAGLLPMVNTKDVDKLLW